MSRIEFDDKAARDILTSTLMSVLTPERKDALLRQALVEVFEKKDNYGTQSLKTIFVSVVQEYTKDRVKTILENDPSLQRRLDEITKETIEVAFDTVRKNIQATIENILKQAMSRGY